MVRAVAHRLDALVVPPLLIMGSLADNAAELYNVMAHAVLELQAVMEIHAIATPAVAVE